jgi:hypothetical protein
LAVRLRWVADAFVAGEGVSCVLVLSLAGAPAFGGAASFGGAAFFGGAASFGGAVSFAGSSVAAPSVLDGFVSGGSIASVAGAV